MRRSGVVVLALVGLLAACGGGETVETADVEWVETPAVEEEAEWKYAALPWTEEALREAYSVGTKLTYSRSGTRKDGKEATGTHTIEVVKIDEGADLVHIDSLWEDALTKSGSNIISEWGHAVLLGAQPSSDDTAFEIVGNEQVETPAGTFDTVVVETSNSFFESKATYWLVVDQPGVYAKWVDRGAGGKEANLVMTLQEISRP